jgi:glycosyltransferase involved in cell wall biosynthesis
MKPLISIIIPTKQEESVIERTLGQFKNLTIPHEVIVSDGGSTDRTIEIANRLASRVVVYQGPDRQNIAGGRNAGAAVAEADILLFFDADCGIPDVNDFFKKALKHFENPRVVGVCPQIKVWKEMRTTADAISFGIASVYHYISNNFFHIGAAMGEFQMVRADVYRKVNGYNEKIAVGEDQDFFKRISHFGRTVMAWEMIVYHTGRRAHKIGWAKLWWEWMTNGFAMHLFSRSVSKEWEVIR